MKKYFLDFAIKYEINAKSFQNKQRFKKWKGKYGKFNSPSGAMRVNLSNRKIVQI
jgi:hypothetical protein